MRTSIFQSCLRQALKQFRRTFRIVACCALAAFISSWLVSPSQAADTNAVIASWLAAQKDLRNWNADFTQTRTLKTLTRPLVATGHVWFAPPASFRWELRSPANTIALRESDLMYVIYPQLKRAERYRLDSSAPGEMREALALLEAGFPRDEAELRDRFQVTGLMETNSTFVISLVPKGSFARRMMTEIKVGLGSKDYSLASTELTFIDGSRMKNEFSNGVMNSQIPPDIFKWQPPADFKVTEPFGK